MSTATHTQDVSLLARADLVLLLADALRPPAEAQRRLLGVQSDDLLSLIAAAGFATSDELLRALRQMLDTARQTPAEGWSDEYHRLFEGAMVCPANETAFIRRDKGAIIGDLAGYYRAFGWQPTAHGGEKADHLITELEFLAMLLAMAAAAPIDQASGAADITASAIHSFVADHLGDWIEAVCERLANLTALELYRDAASSLLLVWRAMAAAHNWPSPVAASASADLTLDEPDTREVCAATDAPVSLTIHRPRPS